jgi:hypothetical protein
MSFETRMYPVTPEGNAAMVAARALVLSKTDGWHPSVGVFFQNGPRTDLETLLDVTQKALRTAGNDSRYVVEDLVDSGNKVTMRFFIEGNKARHSGMQIFEIGDTGTVEQAWVNVSGVGSTAPNVVSKLAPYGGRSMSHEGAGLGVAFSDLRTHQPIAPSKTHALSGPQVSHVPRLGANVDVNILARDAAATRDPSKFLQDSSGGSTGSGALLGEFFQPIVRSHAKDRHQPTDKYQPVKSGGHSVSDMLQTAMNEPPSSFQQQRVSGEPPSGNGPTCSCGK